MMSFGPGGRARVATRRLLLIARDALRTKPTAGTHWSCRTMAEATGIPKSMIHRVWLAFGLQPHRQRTFKLSTDPFFVEKVRDIVGTHPRRSCCVWMRKLKSRR